MIRDACSSDFIALFALENQVYSRNDPKVNPYGIDYKMKKPACIGK